MGQPSIDLLVIGLGNGWRGDDAAGLAVAQALADDPRVRAFEGEPIGLVASGVTAIAPQLRGLALPDRGRPRA